LGYLGGIRDAVIKGKNYENGYHEGQCCGRRTIYDELLETVQKIRLWRLQFSLCFLALFTGSIAFLKVQGIDSQAQISQVLRAFFAAAPLVFTLSLKVYVKNGLTELNDRERRALSQPLAAARSLFDASLVLLLWKPLMEMKSLETLWAVLLKMLW
jgi:hypothetical protein